MTLLIDIQKSVLFMYILLLKTFWRQRYEKYNYYTNDRRIFCGNQNVPIISIRLSSVNSVYFPKKLLVSKNIPKFALVHS